MQSRKKMCELTRKFRRKKEKDVEQLMCTQKLSL